MGIDIRPSRFHYVAAAALCLAAVSTGTALIIYVVFDSQYQGQSVPAPGTTELKITAPGNYDLMLQVPVGNGRRGAWDAANLLPSHYTVELRNAETGKAVPLKSVSGRQGQEYDGIRYLAVRSVHIDAAGQYELTTSGPFLDGTEFYFQPSVNSRIWIAFVGVGINAIGFIASAAWAIIILIKRQKAARVPPRII